MNIVTAIVIYSMIVYITGMAEAVGTSEVGALLPGEPAEGIGLRPGDVITSVENQPVQTWEELTKIIHSKPGQELEISWVRDGQTFTKKVTPELQPQENIGLIGISAKVQYRKVGFFASVGQGFTTSYYILSQIAKALKVIITGEQSFKDAVGGPIIIAKMAGESARLGFQALLMFTAFISLNLGFMNMLPFPVLDGGHLMLLLIEGIRRKPLPVKAVMTIQKVGMAFLIALMIFIIISDFSKL